MITKLLKEITDNENSQKLANDFSQDTFDLGSHATLPSLKSKSILNKTIINYEVPKEILDPIITNTKIELRHEINKDIQTRINETIMKHPSAVNVTQLLKTPELGSSEKSNEDLIDIRSTLTGLKTKQEQFEN